MNANKSIFYKAKYFFGFLDLTKKLKYAEFEEKFKGNEKNFEIEFLLARYNKYDILNQLINVKEYHVKKRNVIDDSYFIVALKYDTLKLKLSNLDISIDDLTFLINRNPIIKNKNFNILYMIVPTNYNPLFHTIDHGKIIKNNNDNTRRIYFINEQELNFAFLEMDTYDKILQCFDK